MFNETTLDFPTDLPFLKSLNCSILVADIYDNVNV